MAKKLVAFTLYYGLGMGTAILALVTVLPSARLSVGERAAHDPSIRHALLVDGVPSSFAPAVGRSATRCPYLAAAATGSACPYMASLAARSGCPVLRGTVDGTTCPFLNGHGGSATDGRRAAPDDRSPTPPTPAPEVEWMPDGTVLALGPAPAPADELL